MPILWKSTKQSVIAESTCQAEYIAAAEGLASTEKLGLLEFFQKDELEDGGLPSPLTLWVDSRSAKMAMCAPEPTSKTRHYVLKFLKVRTHAQSGAGALRFCRTGLQTADALTKYCGPEQRQLLMGNFAARSGGDLC